MQIRALAENDAAAWWQLRLAALETEPFAFGKSAEEHRQTSVETVALRFRHATPDDFTLGAFDHTNLIGIATFHREAGLKERHKGHIYGVYVSPPHRRHGAARGLIAALIESARQNLSLEQIQIAVSTSQSPARELYCSFGFASYGTEPRALKVGETYIDEDHMVLRIR